MCFSAYYAAACSQHYRGAVYRNRVNYWNDYLGPVLFLPDYPTLASGLYKYKVLSIRDYNMGGVNMPILFAGLLVSMLPVVGAYIAFNKKMLDMSFSGGLKG